MTEEIRYRPGESPVDPTKPDPVYERLQPPDHTRVCWSAALGRAGRGHWEPNSEQFALLALEMLAEGRADCICAHQAGRTRARGDGARRRRR
jgi:hypothetical protein